MIKHETRENARQIATSTAHNNLTEQVITRINTKEIAENALSSLKQLASSNGYSLAEMIAFSKPILQEVAAAKGVNLSLRDLDLFEHSMTGLDVDSQSSGLNRGKRPGAQDASGRSISPVSGIGRPSSGSQRFPSGPAYRAPEKIRASIKEILTDALDQKIDPTNELPKAKAHEWTNTAARASQGSFGSYLKSIR